MEMRSPKMQSESRRGGRRTQKKVHDHNLPEELITEILLRLPVKSLLRFKCVCKSWFSLISHPHFAVSHFELVATRIDSQRLVFIAPSHPQILSIDFNASSLYDDSASVPLNLDLLIPINNYYDSGALKRFLMFENDNTHYYNVHIIGSCRGFIVLDLNDVLCVWNPSTGVYRVVHWSPIQSSTLSFKYSIFLRGFGYDPSTDDYLLLLLSYNRHYRSGIGLGRRQDRLTRVEFFSLRDNVWKEIEGTNLSYLNSFDYTDNGVGSYLNGVMHWMALSFDTTLNVIVAFNSIERSFSEVPLPHDFENFDYKSSNLAVLGELLSFCGVWWDYSAEIWVMKEYNVQSSWTRSIVVSADNIPPGHFFPLCSTKNGDIIGTYQRNGLVKFNNKGQLIEDRSYYDGHVSRATAYTESLFSLPRNIQVDD